MLLVHVFVYFCQGSLNHVEYPASLHVSQDKKVLNVPPVNNIQKYGPPVATHTRGGESHINM